MKKLTKFLLAAASVTALAGGAYYFVKNVLNKDSSEDFDDFNDDFDDFTFEDETFPEDETSDSREYVTIPIASEEESSEDTPTGDKHAEDTPTEDTETAAKAES